MRLEPSSGIWQKDPDQPDEQGCKRVAVLISRQIDGELAPGDARDLRMHLAICPTCRQALEAQSKQSRLLAESLCAIWKKEDRARKHVLARNSFMSGRWLPKTVACTGIAAAALFFSGTASAPSSDRVVNTSQIPQVVVQEIARVPVMSVPAASVVMQPISPQKKESLSAATAQKEHESVPSSPNEINEDFAQIDVIANAPIEAPTAPKFESTPVPKVAPAALGSRAESMASLNISAPPKPLPGIVLKFSALSPAGVTEECRMTLLGDILSGKGVVRIELGNGKIIEAAQSEIDSTMPELYRAAVRRLLTECEDMRHRKSVEKAIQRTNE